MHYKHQNHGKDDCKKLRHASGASATSEASNSDSDAESADHSPVPSPAQKKVNEVRPDLVDNQDYFSSQSGNHKVISLSQSGTHYNILNTHSSTH